MTPPPLQSSASAAGADPTLARLLATSGSPPQPSMPSTFDDPLAKRPRSRLALVLWVVYGVIIVGGALLLARAHAPLIALRAPPPSDVILPVPVRDLPMFHSVQAGDIVTTTVRAASVPADAITNTARISGSLALASLAQGHVITKGMILEIPEPTLIQNTVAVAVEGGPTLALGGLLHAGMVVSAWRGADRLAERLLVLAVRRVAASQDANAAVHYVVVLATPVDLRVRVLEAAAAQTLTFTPAP